MSAGHVSGRQIGHTLAYRLRNVKFLCPWSNLMGLKPAVKKNDKCHATCCSSDNCPLGTVWVADITRCNNQQWNKGPCDGQNKERWSPQQQKKKKVVVTWWGVIGRDRGRKWKVRKKKRQSRHDARNSSHSIILVVITVVTTHVKWNLKKIYLAAGLLPRLHFSNGHRGHNTVLPLHSLHESFWTLGDKENS